MNNDLKGTYIEYHILQSFPVTCLNRDDVGSPKTAVVGGATRARVSSQCWKRAVRTKMQELGVKLGIRTTHISKLIAEECKKIGASTEQAEKCAEKMAKELGSKGDKKKLKTDAEGTEKELPSKEKKDNLLFFFSEREAAAFAEYAKENGFNLEEKTDKTLVSDIAKISKKVINKAADGLDIALFGRMIANAADMNVEAAASFSHAISTHKISNEIDFFTALDDFQEEDAQGAAHMGTLEFNSATYYRYISLNLGVLSDNLGGEDLETAIENFTKALYLAVPAARQNTQSGACPWEYAKILIRKGQRMQIPFDTPVQHKNGYMEKSIEALNEYIAKKEKEAASLYGKKAEFTIGDGSMNIDELIDGIKKSIG